MPTTVLTGTIIRSGSIPTTALGGGVISSSVQLATTLPAGTVSSSGQIDYNSITNKLSGVVSSSVQVAPLLPTGTVSSSAQINTGSFSGSLTGSVFASTGSIRLDTGSIRIGFSASLTPPIAPLTIDTRGYTENIGIRLHKGPFTSSYYADILLVDSATSLVLRSSGDVGIGPSLNTAFVFSSAIDTETRVTLKGNGNLIFITDAPGSQIRFRNSGNTRSNLIMTDAGDLTITGSLLVKGASGITGSIAATNGVVSGAAQVTSLVAGQTIAPLNINATGAISGASIQTSGNGTVGGSLTVNQNLIVLGSSSISFISQSTLNVGTNKITMNTNTPGVRFGGIEVIDSGSSPLRSGSLYFDSINDQWIFVHQNTAGGVTSSVLLVGPATFNSIGNETTITQNRVLKGAGLEHIADSQITDNGVTVSITNGLSVGTNLTASNATISGLTANQAVFTDANDGLVSNAITGTGNVVMSTSPTLTGTVTADKMVMSGSQFAGIVSGSGLQYRLVVPVGTNQYAT